MKKAKIISYLLILCFLISFIFMPSVSQAAAEPINGQGKGYDAFSYNSSQQSGSPHIVSKVFLPKGWQTDIPNQFMPRTPGAGETKILTGAAKSAVPTGLIVTKATNSSISVKWNKVSGAKKYTVFVSTSKSSGYKSKGSTKSTSFTVKGLKKNKIYYIKVRSENGKNKSAQSGYAKGKATTKPGFITGFTAKPVDAHTIQLKWNKAANATYYEVYISKDGGDYYYLGYTKKLGVYIYDLPYDSDYSFGVIACNKSGWTPSDNAVSCNTLRYPAPTGLTAKVVDGNKAQLTWKPVKDGKKYDIYYAYKGDRYYSYYDSTFFTSFTITGLRENSNCYFAVCSNFNGDQSALSKEAMIITGYGKPETPYVYSAYASGIDYIYLSWSDDYNVTDYHIYVSSTADGPYTLIDRPASTSTYAYLYGITPSTDYYFKISAVNHGVESDKSEYQYIQVDGVPTIYFATEYKSLNEIYLSWSTVYGATGYNIYEYNPLDGTYTLKGSTSSEYSTSYYVTSYTANTHYYFCVTAKNDYGESDYCVPKEIITGS